MVYGRNGGPGDYAGEYQRELVRKITYIGMSLFFMSYAFFIWDYYGYNDLTTMTINWILLSESAVSLILAVSKPLPEPANSIVPALMIVGSVILFFISVYPSFPLYGTDEIAIDTYSGYLFIHGFNPYNPAIMSSVFTFYSVEPYFVTPLLTGGVVSFLVYPGFSVLLFSLPVLLNFPSNFILIAATIGVFMAIFIYYRKSLLQDVFPTAALLVLININYLYYSVGGVTDIIWVLLVMVSYMAREKPLLSGLIFGLALSFKQTPFLILPFFLYFIYRESGRNIRAPLFLVLGASLSFIATNLPFILMSPSLWLSGIFSIWTQNTIGIGDGLGALSFLGYAALTQVTFNVMFVSSAVLFFVAYVLYYRRMKYAFFAFPVFIFLFHFRLLSNYMMYWPLLIMLVFPDFLADFRTEHAVPHESGNRKAVTKEKTRAVSGKVLVSVALSVIIISSGFIIYSNSIDPVDPPFKVNSVGAFSNPYMIPGSLTSMNVNITYTPSSGMPEHMPILFRIIPSGHVTNANGLLWRSGNTTISPGTNVLTIHPDNVADLLHYNTSFSLVAYYSEYQQVFRHAAVTNKTPVPIGNPGMIYPSNSSGGEVYPSWYFVPLDQGGSARFSYYPGGIILRENHTAGSYQWVASELVNSNVNLTELNSMNYTLKLNVMPVNASSVESSVNRTGYPSTFTGLRIGFDGGSEQIWIGFNSSVSGNKYYIPNSDLICEITHSFEVNFSTVEYFAQSMHWNQNGATISLIVGSYAPYGSYASAFYGLSLIRS